MEKIAEVWRDFTSGKLPVLFDSGHKTAQGHFRKYGVSDDNCDLKACTQKVWEGVRADTKN